MSQQHIALALTVLGTLGVASAFFYVALNSRHEENYDSVIKRCYRTRNIWLWGLIIVGVPLMLGTLSGLPYAIASQGKPLGVDVVGHQWYWEMSRKQVPAGKPVVFHVTSADVNHDFAIYDKDMHVVAQVQAMPGYTNNLAYTFKKPGIYQVLCLQYCGVMHTHMTTTIQVTGGQAQGGQS